MKRKQIILAVALSLLVSFNVFALIDEGKTQEQEMMEAFMKYSTPDKNHEVFKKNEGKWNTEVKMWMTPDSKPIISHGTSEMKVILGGRYLKMVYRSSMMGQPFEGIQIMGYDRFQNKYVTFWIDNMSTAFFLTSGNLDESGKIMTETGIWPDPMTGGTVTIRAVTTCINEDKFIYEMYQTGQDGKEFKVMESVSTRKK